MVLTLSIAVVALGVTLAIPAGATTRAADRTVAPRSYGQQITGDYNGDGIPDVASLDPGNGPTCSVTVQLGLAGGGLGPAKVHSYTTIDTESPCPDQGVAMKLGKQVRSDLVVGYSFGEGELMVLHNFQPTVLVRGIVQPTIMRVQDINGDGRPDLVEVSDQVTEMGTLVNTAQGTLVPGPFGACTAIQQGAPQYVLADFDGDGIPDMLLYSFCPPEEEPNTVAVQFSSGKAPATLVSTFDLYGTFTVFAIDLNYDGVPDVGVVHTLDGTTTVSYFLNDGHGNFTPTSGPQ